MHVIESNCLLLSATKDDSNRQVYKTNCYTRRLVQKIKTYSMINLLFELFVVIILRNNRKVVSEIHKTIFIFHVNWHQHEKCMLNSIH